MHRRAGAAPEGGVRRDRTIDGLLLGDPVADGLGRRFEGGLRVITLDDRRLGDAERPPDLAHLGDGREDRAAFAAAWNLAMSGSVALTSSTAASQRRAARLRLRRARPGRPCVVRKLVAKSWASVLFLPLLAR